MAKRLRNSPHLKKVVEDSIEKLLKEGWAEVVPNPGLKSDLTWYLPAVLSERKGKHRFCLDGAATSCGVSLNSMLLTGEGPMVTIFNALSNARRYDYFACGDIAAFFHQVLIPPEDRDALRFFRWIPGQEDKLECIRMLRNIFGAACSYSISSFANRRNAEDHGGNFSQEVVDAILRAYVDDVPTSSPTQESSIDLVKGLIELCAKGGFTLTKFFLIVLQSWNLFHQICEKTDLRIQMVTSQKHRSSASPTIPTKILFASSCRQKVVGVPGIVSASSLSS